MGILIKRLHDFIKARQVSAILELDDWKDKIRIEFECYELILFHMQVNYVNSNLNNICNVIYFQNAAKPLKTLVDLFKVFMMSTYFSHFFI